MHKSELSITRHLLGMETLTPAIIQYLFERTDYFLNDVVTPNVMLNTLNGRIVTNLFFEPSTRTRVSFEIAAKRLGAIILNPHMDTSATVKGESLLDTIHTFEALGTDIFVIRHSDNNTAQFIAAELSSRASVINGGDGFNQHPTQALLDLYTIYKHKPDFTQLVVAIIGDILHSRVARSFIEGLRIMGTTEIRLIAPTNLVPHDADRLGVKVFNQLEAGLADVDVIMTLRIQKERMEISDIPNTEKYFRHYGLTPNNIVSAKNDAIVMHPGPLNRGVEIDSAVADGPQSVILQQVKHGVAMRMAIMDTLHQTKNTSLR